MTPTEKDQEAARKYYNNAASDDILDAYLAGLMAERERCKTLCRCWEPNEDDIELRDDDGVWDIAGCLSKIIARGPL